MNGFYWLLANLAEPRPTLLLLDDLHWCDEASAAWLRFALRRLEGLPVAMVLAARPYEPGADGSWLSELSDEPVMETLEPAPLSVEAVARLTTSAFGTECESAFSAACHHASAGNPYLLGELLRSIRAEGLGPDRRRGESRRPAELAGDLPLGPGTAAPSRARGDRHRPSSRDPWTGRHAAPCGTDHRGG